MKAKIIVEFRGRKYRLSKGFVCKSKRDCSLFVKGVCDVVDKRLHIPCEDIGSAFYEAVNSWHIGGWKEVK